MAKNHISDFDTTDINNADIKSISLAENVMDAPAVNNAMRARDAISAAFYDDLGGANTVAGTVDAITVTGSITAYATGLVLTIIPSGDNTGAVTLNWNSKGTKAVRKIYGGTDVALVAGDLKSAQPTTLIYDATANSAAGAFVLQAPVVKGLGTLISRQTASASATIDITNIQNSVFDLHAIRLVDVLPATDDVFPIIRFSTDGGSTFVSTTTYSRLQRTLTIGGAAEVASSTATANGWVLSDITTKQGNASGEVGNGIMFLSGLGGSGPPTVWGQYTYLNAAGTLSHTQFSGFEPGTTAIDALRFLFNSGNIASGVIELYGVS